MKRPSLETLLLLGLSCAVLVFASAGFLALANTSPMRPPELGEPADSAVLATTTPTFRWRADSRTAQVEFWLTPDGPAPGIRIISTQTGEFSVPSAEKWCCLRPGIVYRWQVRASDSPIPLVAEDPYWGPWSEERRFTVTGP